MKKTLILAIGLFLSFFTATAQKSNANNFDGVWVGQGHQLNNNETWSIKLTIAGDKMNIEYPSLGCKAKLTKIKLNKNQLFLTEKMTESGTCIDNGKIELELISPNELRFKWSFSDGEPGSYSTLIKF